MNPQVNAVAGRLSLRPPQRRALEILDRVMEIAPPAKQGDLKAALDAIRSEFPSVADFEREFPSLCFALATGVGKTRLMGAFIAYLHLAHGMKNFFVLAPNLTVYNKLIADFTPNTPKYVFRGIAAFAVEPPEIVTGDTYESRGTMLEREGVCKVNIFNISKINSEVRGGKQPRIKRLKEYIGHSYFDYLAGLPDLVLLMDESHRYRASAGVRAINELRPVLGLELTATPQVEVGKSTERFKNIILDYPLGQAMADGFVKEPAVVTRRDFNASGMTPAEVERMKLEDGVRLHEQTKVHLETYAREQGVPIVKPFVLVIARDTTHAADLNKVIEDDTFFAGHYRGKVIQVDSSQTGAKEDEMVARLLRVEDPEEPTEIVVHVNMLKEGWDVTNLYTIVPLRAANARTLIEQSIGRGLRLPYGKRTGVAAVDRLNIVAHDRFQELVDEANKPDSMIHLQTVILEPEELQQRPRTVISQSNLETSLGIRPANMTATTELAGSDRPRAFKTPAEEQIARLSYGAIRRLTHEPLVVPTSEALNSPEIKARILREVSEQYRTEQPGLPGVAVGPDIAAVIARTIELTTHATIDIPTIVVVPTGEVQSGFNAFQLSLGNVNYQAPSEELWVQYLRTGDTEVLGLESNEGNTARAEDYLVSALADFDDVAYDEHADLLYNLAGQMVQHLQSYLSEEDARRVVRVYQRDLARLIHAQLHDHYWEQATGYEVKITKAFAELKTSAFSSTEPTRDFRSPPPDKGNIARYVFGGFTRCLQSVQKFQSDPERMLSVVLDRDAVKWFRPATGQFGIHYRTGSRVADYQPDFVAEAAEFIAMLEPKRRSDLTDADVLAKRDAAVEWCKHATQYSQAHGGKPWKYTLIPDDVIAENMSLGGLVAQWQSA